MTTTVRLPDPVVVPPAPAREIDLAALERDPAAAFDGEVRFDAGSRGACSTDAGKRRDDPDVAFFANEPVTGAAAAGLRATLRRALS